MVSDWNYRYLVGLDPKKRMWALTRVDFGQSDEPLDPPEVMTLAVSVNTDTTNENEIVQTLFDVSAEWFTIDMVLEEGEFEVKLPGFDS